MGRFPFNSVPWIAVTRGSASQSDRPGSGLTHSASRLCVSGYVTILHSAARDGGRNRGRTVPTRGDGSRRSTPCLCLVRKTSGFSVTQTSGEPGYASRRRRRSSTNGEQRSSDRAGSGTWNALAEESWKLLKVAVGEPPST